MENIDPHNAGDEMTPASFKVIGIGSEASGIIEAVKSLGYDGVDCQVAESHDDSVPADNDMMVIIVTVGNGDVANMIARNYHEAGVFTLGLFEDADPDCFDSVMTDADSGRYPDIIRALLYPLLFSGYISYDFNDFAVAFRNTRYFNVLTAENNDVASLVADTRQAFEAKGIEKLAAHICFNRQRKPEITMAEISEITSMLSKMPESVEITWSLAFDNTMPTDKIRFVVIIAGKELESNRLAPN